MKTPPKFEEGSCYESWKRDVNLWTKLTDLDKKKQATAIYLSLTGQARNLASEIPAEDLEKETGVNTLIVKLDSLYLADKSLRQFSAFNKLYNLRRSEGVSINTFISEFEHVYFEFRRHHMNLPDSVQAFILLSACNLNESEKKVVMSGIGEVTYAEMKDVLRRVFSTELVSKQDDTIKQEPVFQSNMETKEEETLYTNKTRGYWRNNRGRRGNFRGQPTFSRGRGARGGASVGNVGNSSAHGRNQTAKVRRCFGCGSKFHWIKDCPDVGSDTKSNNDESESVHLSLFSGNMEAANESNSKLNTLVAESAGQAVLDTGCSSTVCGKKWLQNYVQQLSSYDANKITECSTGSTFTFGDGVVKKALKKVTIPCYLDGRQSTITTDVVDCNIPLLLSKNSMKKAAMKLHFSDDTVHIGRSCIKLGCSTSGHYLLPIGF